MKINYLLFFPILLSLSSASFGQTGKILWEEKYPIKQGFVEVVRQEERASEAGHFSYLYHENKLLCYCDASSLYISPSGNYAIYRDLVKKQTKLFNTKTKKETIIKTPRNATNLDIVEWSEDKNKVNILFFNEADKPPLQFITVVLS